jgi:phosphopantothenate-cysteine ligase
MKVVVTGGGTIAPIDDVRYIANVSSGRFSAAISEACLRLGSTVRHIHAPRAQLPYYRLARLDLDTPDSAAELDRLRALHREFHSEMRSRLTLVPLKVGTVADYSGTLRRVLRDDPPDVIFLAMAVSDFEPEPVAGKIDSGAGDVVFQARRTDKVIRHVRDWAPASYLVGFKLLSNATTEELVRAADAACVVNRADLTVANDLKTLHEGRHTVHLVCPGHATETLGPSPDLARELVARVFALKADRDRAAISE